MVADDTVAYTVPVGTSSTVQINRAEVIDNLPSASNTLTFNYRLKTSFGTPNTAKIAVNVTKLQ